MLTYLLAIAIGLASVGLYATTFALPEVSRKNDLIWSGVGLFYALVLWVCAGRITGGVLLGQMASVALIGWLGWQTIESRWNETPEGDRANAEKVAGLRARFKGLANSETLSKLKNQAQEVASKVQEKAPDLKVPDLKVPDLKMPDLKMPEVKMPKAPAVKSPQETKTKEVYVRKSFRDEKPAETEVVTPVETSVSAAAAIEMDDDFDFGEFETPTAVETTAVETTTVETTTVESPAVESPTVEVQAAQAEVVAEVATEVAETVVTGTEVDEFGDAIENPEV